MSEFVECNKIRQKHNSERGCVTLASQNNTEDCCLLQHGSRAPHRLVVAVADHGELVVLLDVKAEPAAKAAHALLQFS